MAKEFGAILSLKDNFTATMRKALQQQTQFRKDVEKLKKQLDAVDKKRYKIVFENSHALKQIKAVIDKTKPLQDKLKNFKMKIENSQPVQAIKKAKDSAEKFAKDAAKAIKLKVENSKAMAAIKKVADAVKPFRKDLVIAMTLKDKAMEKIKSIGSKVMPLVRKPFEMTVALRDRTVQTFSTIRERVMNLKTMLAGLVIGGTVGATFKEALSSGAMLEKQQVAMEHFIGVQNKGMSAEQIRKEREKYIQALRQNANVTPFDTTEVIAAGARAISIMGGNTKQAMDLVKLAEDMAALNPTKTLEDAIEALTDAKVGEFERLKEFGFKVSAEEFKGYVGKGKNDDLTEAETMKAYQTLVNQKLSPFFAGGAQKLSTTASGYVSTITGTLKSGLQDMGFSILERFKPQLAALANFMSQNGSVFIQFGTKIADGLKQAYDTAKPFFDFLRQNAGTIGSLLNTAINTIKPIFSTIGTVIQQVAPVISSAFTQIVQTVQENASKFQPIVNAIRSIFTGLGVVIRAVVPIIASVFKTVFPIIAGLIGMVGRVVSWLVNEVIVPNIPIIASIIKGMWSKVAPILKSLWSIFQSIAKIVAPLAKAVFEPVFSGIVKTLKWAWSVIEPILSAMSAALSGVSKAVGWVANLVTGGGGKKGGGGGKKHAVGLHRVPYDNYPAILHEGERVLTKKEAKQMDSGFLGVGGVHIGKLADTLIVREEADIDRIADAFVRKLQQAKVNYGGGMA